MNRRESRLYRMAVDMFIDMLSSITKRRVVGYKCNDADTEAFEYFLTQFDGRSVGEEFIRTFLNYQFQSWFNTGSDRDYSRSVRFQWMFGKKAIERWRKFDPEFNARIVRGHVKKLGILRPQVRISSRISELINVLRPVEENAKKEYFNTKRGLSWCVANTTLYHHRSSLCTRCDFKNECKTMLSEVYPKVYVKRGYVKKQ